MAKLSPEQHTLVESWAEAGANLNDVQGRLKSEFGITLTYLDARMLLIDIGVKLKEKAKVTPPPADEPAPAASEPSDATDEKPGPDTAERVTVTADPSPLAGTIASGKALFSDGKTAIWYVDQNGQLGIKAPEPGYQPPPEDIPLFEQQLDSLLQGL